MLEAIRFLEHAGREQLSPADYVSAVTTLVTGEPERRALLAQDSDALVSLLQARPSMFFGVFAPDEEPAEDQPFEDQPELPADAEIHR
jgi:hypothetical protein